MSWAGIRGPKLGHCVNVVLSLGVAVVWDGEGWELLSGMGGLFSGLWVRKLDLWNYPCLLHSAEDSVWCPSHPQLCCSLFSLLVLGKC